MSITPEQLLAEIDDLLRMAPQNFSSGSPEINAWLGRAAALLDMWDGTKAIRAQIRIADINSGTMERSVTGVRGLMTMLNQARAKLRLVTGQLTVAIERGKVFDYFDEIRKIIEVAQKELFFIDPYLDAEFVSRYVINIKSNIIVRLLTSDKSVASLKPAVEAIRQQNSLNVEMRSTKGMHDRYFFVDSRECYQSGASFKDGAKKAPTTLTQIVDAFSSVLGTYEQMWAEATVV
jgi:hypothetical protein